MFGDYFFLFRGERGNSRRSPYCSKKRERRGEVRSGMNYCEGAGKRGREHNFRFFKRVLSSAVVIREALRDDPNSGLRDDPNRRLSKKLSRCILSYFGHVQNYL